MDELLEQFMIEGPELVQQAADDLLTLEKTPHDGEVLNSAFRAIHTLKGSIGLFDAAPMGQVLQTAEDVMVAMRRRDIPLQRQTFSALLAAVSHCETWLTELGGDGRLGPDAETAAARLTKDLQTSLTETEAVGGPADLVDGDTGGWALSLASRHADALTGPAVAVRYRPDPEAYFNGDDPLAILRRPPHLIALETRVAEPLSETYDPFVCVLVFEALYQAPLADVRSAFRLLGEQVLLQEVLPLAPVAAVARPTDQTVRVALGRLDALADLVGELLVAKNALAIQARQDDNPALQARAATLERLTFALHGQVQALRLTSLAPVFRRLRPLVREIAASLGKDVDLVVDGEGVEADKTIADALYEPLMHLVRNAVDHGVETPDERVAIGKPARATLKITARSTGGAISITLADDGRGLDPQVIRRVAAERGLATQETLSDLSDEAAINLVFEPGFSTAQSVTEVSGRGVGMDAVRAAMSRLGGAVFLKSALGLGATVTLSAPMMRMMTKIMILHCGQERFGAPFEAIVETLQISRDQIFAIRHGEAFLLRSCPVPLVRLSTLLGLDDAGASAAKVVVIGREHGLIGVAVDAFGDRLDAIVRPIDGLLTGAPGLLGTTLLGDGQVLLVLDLEALAK